MNLRDFRYLHPEYDDIPDDQLADGLYNKFYKDKMDRDEFNDRLGLPPKEPAPEPEMMQPVPIPDVVPMPQPEISEISGAFPQAEEPQVAPPSPTPEAEIVQTEPSEAVDYPELADPTAGIAEIPPPAVGKWQTLKNIVAKISSGVTDWVKDYEKAQRLARHNPEIAEGLDWINQAYDRDIQQGMLRPEYADPSAETIANVATQLGAMGLTGIAGLTGALEMYAEIHRQAIEEGTVDVSKAMEKAVETIKAGAELGEAIVYEPRGVSGKKAVEGIESGFEQLTRLADYLGERAMNELLDAGAPLELAVLAGTAVGTAVEASPILIPEVGRRIARSTPARMMTNKERRLVVQSIEEQLARDPDLTPGQRARRFKSEFDRLYKERQAAEKPVTTRVEPEVGTKPPPEPAGPPAARKPAAPETPKPAPTGPAQPPVAPPSAPELPSPDILKKGVLPYDTETQRRLLRGERKEELPGQTVEGRRALPEPESGQAPAAPVGAPQEKVKPGKLPKKPRKGRPKPLEDVKNLRAAIRKLGGINFLNFKGELKDMQHVKINRLAKKTGLPIDLAEQSLKDAGWLSDDENLLDVLRDPENLMRGSVRRDVGEKTEAEKTQADIDLEKQMGWEPEAPPEGDYITMTVDDLPEGKKLTIIEGESKEGWDVYEVTEKDPFGVTLTDGQEINLAPGQKVQVLKTDLPKKEPESFLKGEKAMGAKEAELRAKKRTQSAGRQEGLGLVEPAPKGDWMKGEQAGKKEAASFKKKVDKAHKEAEIKPDEIKQTAKKYEQLQLNFGPPEKVQALSIPQTIPDIQSTRMVTTGSLKAAKMGVKTPADAAGLLSHLEIQPQEHLYTIATDNAGNVLEVHRYAKGTLISAAARSVEIAGRIFNVPNVKNAYIVHNHPGGSISPSDADRLIMGLISHMLRLNDVEPYAMIVAKGRYSTFEPETGEVFKGYSKQPQEKKYKVPEKERELVSNINKNYGQMSHPNVVMQVVDKYFKGVDGWILLTSANNVIGIHRYKKGVPQGQAMVDLIAHIERSAAAGMVFVNNGPMPAKRRRFILDAQRALSGDIALHDIIEDGKSLYSTGEYKPSKTGQIEGIKKITKKRTEPLYSTGEYAKTDKSKYKEKKPKGPPPKPWGADKRLPPIFDLPEMVQIAKALGKGDYPKIVKRIGRSMATAGAFYPAGKGRVEILAALGPSPEALAKTLAHEIGHWVDYLPDHMIRGRGNILGRLASLKKYMKHTLPGWKGAPGELTKKDRDRLRREAKKMIESEERWIDEIIEKEFPITADDILNIWKATDPAALADHAELYDFIQRANTAKKKAIVRAALKGVVPQELKKFAKKIKVATGKKIKWEATDEDIKKKYQELILKELKKRQLFELKEIMGELKELSVAYKPFDPAMSAKYTRYRFSGVELYADFFSAILNDPWLAQKTAPQAWEAFFNYLDAKPEFRELYQKILDDIYSGKKNPELVKTLREGFRKGDQEWFDKMQRPTVGWTQLKRDLIDSNAFLLKYIRDVKRKGVDIPADVNPLYAVEDMMYSMAEVESLVQEFARRIVMPLRAAGIDYDDFGLYVLYRRIVHPKSMGGREEFANPEGLHPERAKELMKELEERYGREKLMELVHDFRNVHEKYFVEKSEQNKIHSDELLKHMQDAVAYATFDVNGFMDSRYGSAVGHHVKRQMGTFKSIKNPVTATLMKDIAFTRFAYRNRAKESIVKFLAKNFPGKVKWTKKRYVYKRQEFVPVSPNNPDWGTVFYFKKGELKAYDIPKEIARSVNVDPIGLEGFISALRFVAQPFRKIFTELNPGFWIMNIFRDYMSSVSKIPGNSIIKFADSYLAGIKPAFRSVYGIPDPVIEEMRSGNPMLITVADWRGLEPHDKQIERLLAQYHLTPTEWRKRIREPFWRFMIHVSNIGRAMERAGKVGGYIYLKKRFPAPKSKIAHDVRHYAGSPSFLTMGRGAPIVNNILLFANPQIQDWRENYRSFKEDKKNYAWKKMKYTLMPKLIMFGGSAGILGAALKHFYDQVSEYDKANYTIVPIGFTKSGKSVYLRIPNDESSRFLGGMIWKAITGEKDNVVSHLADYAGGQVPSLTPAYGNLVDIAQYASGKNPYDYFRGKYAIPEQVFKAGGARSHKAFLKYMANNSGAGIVYKFDTDDLDRIKTELEQFLRYPIVNNVVGRFIKVSDQGSRFEYSKDRGRIQKELARQNLDITDVLTKYVNGETLTDKDILKLSKNPDIIPDKIIKLITRRHGHVFLQNLLAAQSDKEKVAVIKKYLEIEQDRRAAMAEGKLPIVGGDLIK